MRNSTEILHISTKMPKRSIAKLCQTNNPLNGRKQIQIETKNMLQFSLSHISFKETYLI